MDFLGWINDQLLRMQWLHDAMTALVEGPLGMSTQERMGATVHFFLYDAAKILILLTVLIFVLSWIQSHFPPERTKSLLGARRGLGANALAALLGTVTPFCSCSSIPLFIGFTRAGLPLGVTFSFLISSPLVDLASLVLLASVFNWTIALAYVVAGVVLAILGGALIDRLGMEAQIEPLGLERPVGRPDSELTPRERAALAWSQTRAVLDKVTGYVLIGVGIGAAVHNWVPQGVIDTLLGSQNWWSVPAATLVGVPMYADCFGTLPVAEALVGRGVGLGTALSLMMAITALSLPSLVMLRRVVRPRLLAVFTAIIVVGILIIGYLFNWLAPILA